MLLSIWNYNNFDNFLVSRLFKARKIVNGEELTKKLEPPLFLNIVEWLIDSSPKCLRCKRCCKKSERLRELELAREKLNNEINIIEIVKSRRLIKKVIKQLIGEEMNSKMSKDV